MKQIYVLESHQDGIIVIADSFERCSEAQAGYSKTEQGAQTITARWLIERNE